MKKPVAYIIVGILAISVLVLVYLFLTKGYSGNGVNIAPILPSPVSSGTSTGASSQEIGNVASTNVPLTITSPKDGSTLGSTDVTVTGKTVPDADVFVNDQSGKADTNGNFSINVALDEGQNQIVVSANDANGNAAEQDLTVTVVSFQ
jgi:bacillopeptidase F